MAFAGEKKKKGKAAVNKQPKGISCLDFFYHTNVSGRVPSTTISYNPFFPF